MTGLACVNQPSVLYHLKCLFRVSSCSPWLPSWGSEGKTSWVIIITRTRKGGQRQWNLSHPSHRHCDLNSFAPPLLPAPRPHVWCERMTPPFSVAFLHTSPTPHQMNSKQVQLQLMGWLGSLSAFPPSGNIRPPCKHTFSKRMHPMFSYNHLKINLFSFVSIIKYKDLDETACLRRSQSVGTTVSDGLDSTSVEPRFAITGTHRTQTHTVRTKGSNILIAQTSWCNYTVRKLTRQCVCCSKRICMWGGAGRQRGWEGECRFPEVHLPR